VAGVTGPSGPPGIARYSASIGDGSATTIDVTHGLGTRDIIATTRRATTPWDEVYPEVQALTTNACRFIFASPPTVAQFRVTLHA